MNPNTKKLIGAVIAAVLAIAVYYGAISQQSANSIQTQTNQSLGTSPAGQPGAPQASQTTNGSAPAASPAPNAAPNPQH